MTPVLVKKTGVGCYLCYWIAGNKMTYSIDKNGPGKPAKPYKDFPLYAHASKRWAKKIKGKTYFFGHWDNWQKSLEKYQHDVHWRQLGQTPPLMNPTALTMEDMVNGMLEAKEPKILTGELTNRSFGDYKRTGAKLLASIGRHKSVESLTPTDFSKLRVKLAKGVSLVSLGNEIGRIRVFFKWAYDSDLIEKPIKYGPDFAKPDRRSLKKEKQSKPGKEFTISELQTLFHAASPTMKTFILLGLNGGLGPSDIGQLEKKHLRDGWIVYPRPKTLVDRSFPLWKETQKAVEVNRQTKYPDSALIFLTKYGQPWYRDAKVAPLSHEFRKLCIDCCLHKEGRGFYSLRHQFRTIADGCRDQVAVNHIMGHTDTSMGAVYREWIEPDRLQAVVDHVYQWIKPMFKKPRKKKES